MEKLELNQELYNNIAAWMQPKFALTTQRQRLYFLRKIFKTYKYLDREILKTIIKTFKHQHQRAAICMINKYCEDNDIDFYLKVQSISKQDSKLPEILSPAEIKLMINATPKPYDLVIRCIFNMGAGLRVSEIIKMSWDHIRWIDWLSNQDNYGVALIKSGKGSKDRIVNIPTKLMKDLYAYAKEIDNLNEFRVPKPGLMFPFGGLSKKFIDRHGVDIDKKWKADYVLHKYNWFRYNIVHKCCEKALNKKIKIHQLRHSRATYLYEYENVPIEKIQILLGHKSLNTTMLYTRVSARSVFEMLKETKEV